MTRRIRLALLTLLIPFVLPLGAQIVFNGSNLPIVVLQTNGQSIPDEPKITAQMGIRYAGAGQVTHPNAPPNVYNGLIGIELRGSSSQSYPKKAYSIELRDGNGDALNLPILGMPEENDWALIAPLNDKTLLRDALIHAIARQVLPWSPRTRFCEVVLNGEYMGVYTLIETIKRDANRVAIRRLDPDDITGDRLTGGYLLRIDKYGPSPGTVGGNWVSHYPPAPGAWQQTWFQYDDPKAAELQPVQANYIQNYIGEFEDMIAGPDFSSQYANWIDVDNWIDFLLVNEISKNIDAYRLSTFFYKDRDSEDPRLKMGPVWDFNIAFGIGDYCEGNDWSGWAFDFNSICPNDAWIIHFWWDRLLSDPAFRARLKTRWKAHRAGPWSDANLFSTLDSMTNLLQEAQVRNFQRWPVLGNYVWPNAFIGQSYSDEITYLENWLRERLAWMDQHPLLFEPEEQEPSDFRFALGPNPTTDHIWISIADNVPAGSTIQFRLTALTGQQVVRLRLPADKPRTRINLEGYNLSSGLYLARIEDLAGNVYIGKLVVER